MSECGVDLIQTRAESDSPGHQSNEDIMCVAQSSTMRRGIIDIMHLRTALRRRALSVCYSLLQLLITD